MTWLPGPAATPSTWVASAQRLVLDVEQLPVDAVLAARPGCRAAPSRRGPARTARTATSGRGGPSTVTGSSAASCRGPAARRTDRPRAARARARGPADPRRVGVLEVGDLVGEHHRLGAPVAVEQGDPRARIGEHRGRDREHGRDAGCRPRSARAGPAVARSGVNAPTGAAPRRRRPPDLVDQPAGEQPAGHLAHADARRGAGGRADRVRAALLDPVDRGARQGLAGGERERRRAARPAPRRSPRRSRR